MNILLVFIKYFFIALCGFYVFCKLQNLHISKIEFCLIVLGSILTSLLYMLFKKAVPQLYILAVVIPFILLAKIFLRQSFKTAIPIGLIAISASFVFAVIGVVVGSGVLYFAYRYLNFSQNISTLIQNILVGLLQMLFAYAIFKIKRFKKGIPNLENYVDSDLSLYISVAIILIMSFSEIKSLGNIAITLIIFIITILGINMFFIWRVHLKKTYIQRQFYKEIDALNENIEKLQKKNADIEAENQALAKVIHRDNKVISSLINTLTVIVGETTDAHTQEKLEEFVDYLHEENADRKQYFQKPQTTCNQIPKTNVFAVDGILELMKNKAVENGIDFNVQVDCSVDKLINESISEVDLTTILADLIENAIIATKHSENKLIEVMFYIENGCYALKVCDTGIPFEPIVLQNFGAKRVTTHINDGGSGIGLVTICELVKKYQASFYLNQECGKVLKTIEIIFDKNCGFKIGCNNNVAPD